MAKKILLLKLYLMRMRERGTFKGRGMYVLLILSDLRFVP